MGLIKAHCVQGIVGILPTAPFYGVRKPSGQYKWFLRSVYDIEVQAVGIALEAACLLHWAKSYFGPVPLVLTGMSLGGAMAGLASRLYPYEVAVVPYMGCNGPGYSYSYGMHPNPPAIWCQTLATWLT
jgi:dienelactone hydrolase